MKNLFSRLTASILIFILIFNAVSTFGVRAETAAAAAYDIKGHWAEAVLTRALSDALIDRSGGPLRPDAPMTGAEILTILCRVLSADRTADLSGFTDISKDDPGYTAAAQAAALGLTAPLNKRLDLDKPVTRSKAFAELAEAFQIAAAGQDTTVLSAYTGGETLSGKNRIAAAALVSGGFVAGFDHSLHINDDISLAEFLTVLYKIVPNYKSTPQAPAEPDATDSAAVSGDTAVSDDAVHSDGAVLSDGAVVSGDSTVTDTQFSGSVYMDCSTSDIQLANITAPAVVLRSDIVDSFSVTSSKIDRLVFAAGSGDVTFSPDPDSVITTVAVGTGGGTITLGGSIQNVEITGSRRMVIISGSVKNLLVSGSGNTIMMPEGASAEVIKIFGTGTGNTVTLGGMAGECDIYGSDTVVNGTGTVQQLADNSKNSIITVLTTKAAVNNNYGLNDVTLKLITPINLSSYESLRASVSIQAPEDGKSCRGTWYIDDAYVSESDVTIGTTPALSLESDLENRSDTTQVMTLTFVLSSLDSDGNYQEIRTDENVTLIGHTESDAANVLALVKTGYKGNYTLLWAQAHDYDKPLKAAFVNNSGYSSTTHYLVWVSIAYQRANVFTGSAGNWKLTNTFIIGSGAAGKDTPTGVFKIIGRSTKGWTTKLYTVKPVIYFLNTAYGFHSRLYKPKTTTVSDSRIGYPISHGCIRMYDDDVAWFYDNIPTGTTVVVY
jgi:lipoprotein-anchoring transpeptidase ErfK/SrfK